MNLAPTPFSAALAGAFAGAVMPILWSRMASDSTVLVIAFLLVVALPAHAFVVGFRRPEAADPKGVDAALLKRVGAWLLCAAVAVAAGLALR